MSKYIVSGYWHDRINNMTSPIFPTVYNTSEEAFADLVKLVEDDLDDVHYICTCYKNCRCYYTKNDKGRNIEVASIGRDNAFVNCEDVFAEYIVTEWKEN